MKRIAGLFFALVCLVAIGILALPTIAGSKWVYQPLVDRLAAERFRLEIGDVRLGWFRPLAFNEIELFAPEDSLSPNAPQSVSSEASLVKIESIRSNRTLLEFLWNGRNLGMIEIVKPNVDVRLLEDGSNLERLIREITNSGASQSDAAEADKSAEAKKPKSPPLLDIQIVVKGFHVTVTDDQTQDPIVVIPPFDTDVSYKSLDVDSQVIVAPTRALDQVVITQRLVHLGLSKAVPLLASSTEFDGKISLESGEIRIPLAHPQDATGTAALTLHSVRTVPTDPTILGAIDLLGRLFKRQLPHELTFVDGSIVTVEVADQTVKHSGVRAGLPQVDERLQIATAGEVGLVDRRLNLGIEIPVPLEQLARRQTVKQLGVPSITLPIGGTLDKPELDWTTFRQDSAGLLSSMSTALSTEAPLAGTVVGALSELAEGNADEAIEEGVDLVKQILQRRQERKAAEQEALSEQGEAPPEKSERPLRDALKNIFRDR